MKTAPLIRLLLVLLAVIAVPGIACFGYYSLESFGNVSGFMSTLIVLAYPLALIGFAWLVIALFDKEHSPSLRWLAATLFVVPTLLLLIVRSA